MVVSAHPLASRAGAAVLRKGGNAVDAAVATSLMLGVVEPAFSGIGGGGFALLRMNTGECVALDYRETAPLESSPAMFADGTDRNMIGPLAIATPGVLAGHAKLLEDFGTMNFTDLVAPAVRMAKSVDGLTLSREILRDKNSAAYKKIRRFQTSSRVFVGKKKFPLLGKTLERLGADGPDEFYHGFIAETVSGYLKRIGGVLSREDFEKYAPKKRKPVTGEYMGLDLISMPPPSAGGTLLIRGLQVAETLGPQKKDKLPLSTAPILRLIMREKWRFGDPDFVDVPVGSLLSKGAVRKAAYIIRAGIAVTHTESRYDAGSTSHFSVIDKEGNAVGVTETIECYYGSGVTIPGLGVVMNDEMHDFDVAPGRPNSVAPLKRPASSMTPTIVTKDGSPFLVLGGAGSERIISSVFQTIRNVVEGRLTLPRAVARPRIHFAKETVEVEGGNGNSILSALLSPEFKLHLRSKKDKYFGGVHAIMVDPDSGMVCGSADPRRKGAAAAA
jgi:gamma-glutamyltranspeptidase/glutathione hydrolase